MNLPMEGGCACGEVRYRCDAEPVRTFQCHCRDCQRATGAPFVAAIVVPIKSFHWLKGAPTFYSTPSLRGGENTRSFCPRCGSRLTGGQRPAPWPYIGVTASSLDDPSGFRPAAHYFVSQAQPWDAMADDLPKHETYPPAPPKAPEGDARR